jgi:hypothetical protein
MSMVSDGTSWISMVLDAFAIALDRFDLHRASRAPRAGARASGRPSSAPARLSAG